MSNPLRSPEERARLRALHEAVPACLWEVSEADGIGPCIETKDTQYAPNGDGNGYNHDTATLAVAAVNALPDALALLDEQDGRLKEAVRLLGKVVMLNRNPCSCGDPLCLDRQITAFLASLTEKP